MKFRLVEENELEKRAKYHRKRQKGMSPFYSPDGGNVPLAMDKFNNSTADGANGLMESKEQDWLVNSYKHKPPMSEWAIIEELFEMGYDYKFAQSIVKRLKFDKNGFTIGESLSTSPNGLCEDFELLDSEPVDISYKDFYDLVDTFFQEYKSVEAEHNPDTMYEIQRNFYKKYRPFVDKCKNIMNSINVTGYGRNDYYLLKIWDLCKVVDNNFPYGWRV